MRKIVSIAVAGCFILNTVAADLALGQPAVRGDADTLSVGLKTDDLIDPRGPDITKIRLALEGALVASAAGHGTLDTALLVTDLNRPREAAGAEGRDAIPVFRILEADEPTLPEDFHAVRCRFAEGDARNARTYYAIFSEKKDGDGGYAIIEICSELRWKSLLRYIIQTGHVPPAWAAAPTGEETPPGGAPAAVAPERPEGDEQTSAASADGDVKKSDSGDGDDVAPLGIMPDLQDFWDIRRLPKHLRHMWNGLKPVRTWVYDRAYGDRYARTEALRKRSAAREDYLGNRSKLDLGNMTLDLKPTSAVFIGLTCADKFHDAPAAAILPGMQKGALVLAGNMEGSIDPDSSRTKAYISTLPRAIQRAFARLKRLQSGGPGSAAARVCAQLSGKGADISLVTSVGKDGRPFLNAFKKLGIKVGGTHIAQRLKTAYTLVFEHGQGERSFLHDISASSELTIDKLTPEQFRGKKVAEFGGIELTGLMKDIVPALQMALDAGCITVFDTVADPTHQWKALHASLGDYYLEEVLSRIKVFAPSFNEATQIMHDYGILMKEIYHHQLYEDVDAITPNDVIAFFVSHGAQLIYLKEGRRGVHVWAAAGSAFGNDKELRFDVPIMRGFRAVSDTGTGDAFAGGLTYALSQGWDPMKAALFANVVGGICVQYRGGTLGDETLVDALYYMERLKAQMIAEAFINPETAAKAGAMIDRLKERGNTRLVSQIEKEIANAIYLQAFSESTALPPEDIERADFGMGDFNTYGLLLEVVSIFNAGGGRGHTGKILINQPNQLLVEHVHKDAVVLKKGAPVPAGYKLVTDVVNDFKGVLDYNADGTPAGIRYSVDDYTIVLANDEHSRLGPDFAKEWLVEELEGKSETFLVLGEGVLLTDTAQVLSPKGYDPKEIPPEWQAKAAAVREREGANITAKGTIYVKAGSLVLLPKGTKHSFLAGDKGALYIEFSGPSADERDDFTDSRVVRLPQPVVLSEGLGTVSLDEVIALRARVPQAAQREEAVAFTSSELASLTRGENNATNRLRLARTIFDGTGHGDQTSADYLQFLRGSQRNDLVEQVHKQALNVLIERAIPFMPALEESAVDLRTFGRSDRYDPASFAKIGQLSTTLVNYDIGDGKGHVGRIVGNMPYQYAPPVLHPSSGTFKCVGGSSIMFIENPNYLRGPPAYNPYEIPAELAAAFESADKELGLRKELKGLVAVHVVPGVEVRVPKNARYAFFAGDKGFAALEFTSPPAAPSNIEIINHMKDVTIKAVAADWDGTISLIREGWEGLMTPLVAAVVDGKELTDEEVKELCYDVMYGRTFADGRLSDDDFMTPTMRKLVDTGRISHEAMVWARDMIDETKGEPTPIQFGRACEKAQENGNAANFQWIFDRYRESEKKAGREIDTKNPGRYFCLHYLEYLDIIRNYRLGLVREGKIKPEALLVKGGVDWLKAMRNRGVRVLVLTGSSKKSVEDEVAFLGLSDFIEVFGFDPHAANPSKEDSIRRIMARYRLNGNQLLVIGDGKVEIAGGVKLACFTTLMESRDNTRILTKLRDLFPTNFLKGSGFGDVEAIAKFQTGIEALPPLPDSELKPVALLEGDLMAALRKKYLKEDGTWAPFTAKELRSLGTVSVSQRLFGYQYGDQYVKETVDFTKAVALTDAQDVFMVPSSHGQAYGGIAPTPYHAILRVSYYRRGFLRRQAVDTVTVTIMTDEELKSVQDAGRRPAEFVRNYRDKDIIDRYLSHDTAIDRPIAAALNADNYVAIDRMKKPRSGAEKIVSENVMTLLDGFEKNMATMLGTIFTRTPGREREAILSRFSQVIHPGAYLFLQMGESTKDLPRDTITPLEGSAEEIAVRCHVGPAGRRYLLLTNDEYRTLFGIGADRRRQEAVMAGLTLWLLQAIAIDLRLPVLRIENGEPVTDLSLAYAEWTATRGKMTSGMAAKYPSLYAKKNETTPVVSVDDLRHADAERQYSAGSSMSGTDEALLSRITVADTEEKMGMIAAAAILQDIQEAVDTRGRAVMLFASAPSQHATWEALLALWARLPAERRRYLASRIVAFHMDEYLGLPEGAEQLFGKVLRERLFTKLGIPNGNIHYFNDRLAYETAIALRVTMGGEATRLTAQLEDEARAHAEEIKARFMECGGQFDIVVGGIGKLPHVAFNDPPEARFDDPELIKVVRLTETSRQQQVDDGEFAAITDVPTHALTFSLPPIFAARHIHIIVPRAFKADSVRRTLDGAISEADPASGLRLPEVLPNVRFYFDRAAASQSRVAQEALRRSQPAPALLTPPLKHLATHVGMLLVERGIAGMDGTITNEEKARAFLDEVNLKLDWYLKEYIRYVMVHRKAPRLADLMKIPTERQDDALPLLLFIDIGEIARRTILNMGSPLWKEVFDLRETEPTLPLVLALRSQMLHEAYGVYLDYLISDTFLNQVTRAIPAAHKAGEEAASRVSLPRDTTSAAEELAVILEKLKDASPEVRAAYAMWYQHEYPQYASEIEAYYASLPISGKAILDAAKRTGRPVIACNVDNGELSALTQIRAMMLAAAEQDAYIFFEVGPDALKTYAEGKPHLPEYCAREAYRIYRETGMVVTYGVHLDHNQIKATDYYKGSAEDKRNALQAAITRARFALAQGFTSFATDTSTLTEVEKEDVRERLANVIETGAEILQVIHEGTRQLGVSFGNEGEVGDIGTEISTVEEALTYYRELVGRLSAVCAALGIDLSQEAPIDIIALNIGTAHGYDFDKKDRENDAIKPYQRGRINVARAKEVHEAFKAMGLNVGVALHGFSGTPIEFAHEFVDTGIAKVNINTDWQAVTWKVLEEYYPALYRELFDLARASIPEAKRGVLVTDDADDDFAKARNRIIFGFARQLFRTPANHPLLERITRTLQYDTERRRVARVQELGDHLNGRLTLNDTAESITAAEAIEMLTHDRVAALMEAMQLKDSAEAVVPVEREKETRLQEWQITTLANLGRYEVRRAAAQDLAERRGFIPFLGAGLIPLYNTENGTEHTLYEVFNDAELQSKILIWAVKRYNLDGIPAMMDLTIEDEAILVSSLGDEAPTPKYDGVAHPQLKCTLQQAGVDWRDVIAREIDVTTAGRMHIQAETIRRMRDEFGDTKVKVGYVKAPYTLVLDLIGTEDTMLARMTGGEAIDKFNAMMRYAEEVAGQYAEYLIDSGADVIAFLDPTPTGSLEPEDFKTYSVDVINRLAERVKKHGALAAYHPCRMTSKNVAGMLLPVLGKAKVDILSIDSIYELNDVYDAVAASAAEEGRVAPILIGNIDTLNLLPNGTTSDTYTVVDRLYRKMGPQRPFFCGTSCDADPRASTMDTFAKAVATVRAEPEKIYAKAKEKRRIFIAGGAGYIGSATARSFDEKALDEIIRGELDGYDYEITVADNLWAGHRDALPKGVTLAEVDLSDRSGLVRALEASGADTVIHFGAFIEAGVSMREPAKFYDNNVMNTINLLEAMREAGVKNFVFSSSAAVYGNDNPVPIGEDADFNPVSAYGDTKLLMELLLKEYAREYAFRVVALRYFNAAGAFSAECGEAHCPEESHIIPRFIKAVLSDQDIQIFGDGSHRRDYVSVKDLAIGHRKAVQWLRAQDEFFNPDGPGIFEAFNLGSGQMYSNQEVAEAVIALVKKVTGHEYKGQIVHGPDRPGDPQDLGASNKKARSVLGWSPRYSALESIITDAINWHVKHPEGYGDVKEAAPELTPLEIVQNIAEQLRSTDTVSSMFKVEVLLRLLGREIGKMRVLDKRKEGWSDEQVVAWTRHNDPDQFAIYRILQSEIIMTELVHDWSTEEHAALAKLYTEEGLWTNVAGYSLQAAGPRNDAYEIYATVMKAFESLVDESTVLPLRYDREGRPDLEDIGGPHLVKVAERRAVETASVVMNAVAKAVGPTVAPPVVDYTVFVAHDVYRGHDDEFRNDQELVYRNSFHLEWVRSNDIPTIVRQVRAALGDQKRRLNPHNVVVQLPATAAEAKMYRDDLDSLRAVGVKFMVIDAEGLSQEGVPALREQYRRSIYARLILARRFDETTADDPLLRSLLAFLVESHMDDCPNKDAAVDEYLEALKKNDDLEKILKVRQLYSPLERYRGVPAYGAVTATLIAA